MPLELFTPFGVDTTAVSVSASTASGALNLPSASTDLSSSSTKKGNMGGVSVRVYNSTTAIVFIQFGDSTVTATTAKMPIPSGNTETFQIGPSVTHVAGITASVTGTLYCTTGVGS